MLVNWANKVQTHQLECNLAQTLGTNSVRNIFRPTAIDLGGRGPTSPKF